MIGIRVDSNKTIAMGHLMRCLSIAIQLRKNKKKVIFIISDKDSLEYIVQNKFECVCLENKYNEKNKEINKIHNIVEEYKIETIMIDSYEVTPEYLSGLHKFVKLAYIDDLNMFKYDVDMIINYTFGVERKIYSNYSRKVKFLLGIKYVPLRETFSNDKIEIKKDIQNIMITSGGSDECDILMEFVHSIELNSSKDKVYHIILGKFYGKYEEMREIAEKNSNIKLYRNVKNIDEIMRKCDLAISAGGTTIAELCACGIPTICYASADNQIPGIIAYTKAGIIKYVGDGRKDNQLVIKQIENLIPFLEKEQGVRKQMSTDAKKYIDGLGANRVAQELL